MHDGRFSTLDQVVEFYNSGSAPPAGPASEGAWRRPARPRPECCRQGHIGRFFENARRPRACRGPQVFERVSVVSAVDSRLRALANYYNLGSTGERDAAQSKRDRRRRMLRYWRPCNSNPRLHTSLATEVCDCLFTAHAQPLSIFGILRFIAKVSDRFETRLFCRILPIGYFFRYRLVRPGIVALRRAFKG